MSYSTLLIAALLAVSYGFTKIPNSYTIAQRTSACQDYCKGQSISVTTGFAFLTSGWQLCTCPIAQLSGQWIGTGCFTECRQRCVNTWGTCARSGGSNNTGVCCSTANINTTIETQCYSVPNGACYFSGSG